MPEQRGDRHAEKPLYFRPAPGDAKRLAAYVAAIGSNANATLRRILTEYLDRHDPETNPESQKES